MDAVPLVELKVHTLTIGETWFFKQRPTDSHGRLETLPRYLFGGDVHLTVLALQRLIELLPDRYRKQSDDEWQTLFKDILKAGQGQDDPDVRQLREVLPPILFEIRPGFDTWIDTVVYMRWLTLVVRYVAPLNAPPWLPNRKLKSISEVLSQKPALIGDLLFGDERIFRQALAAVVTPGSYHAQWTLSLQQKNLLDSIQNAVTVSNNVESLIASWTDDQVKILVTTIQAMAPNKKTQAVPPRTLLELQMIFRRPYTRGLLVSLFLVILASVGPLADSLNVLPPSIVVLARILTLTDFLGFAGLYGYSMWKDNRNYLDDGKT